LKPLAGRGTGPALGELLAGHRQSSHPLLPLFPDSRNHGAPSGLSATTKTGAAEMGVGDQFACASLVAAFSLALFITANLFVEARASKSIVLIPAAQQTRIVPL
jgi:hypothetical protein